MKITMYELLRMIKDDKAPKKIMYNNIVWEYVNHEQDYRSRHNAELFFNDEIDNTWIMTHLNTQIEILEEKKIPEKLETYKEVDDEIHFANILKVSKNGECETDEATSVIVDKINEIIDYLKSKGDE